MSYCIACGSKLETYEYQSRSADEAHTVVTTCNQCPVDATKLLPDSPMPRPLSGRRAVSGSRFPLRVSSSTRVIETLKRVIIDVPKDHEYETIELTSNHMTVSQPVVSEIMGSVKREGIITVEGPGIKECICESSSEIVGMGIVIVVYDIYKAIVDPQRRKTIQGTWVSVAPISGYNTCVYQKKGSESRVIIVEMGIQYTHSDNGQWAKIINDAYCQGILHKYIDRYIPRDVMSKLSNLASRAWDKSSPPLEGHCFTCKPDGERMWLVLYGRVWYMVRPRFSSSILQWVISSRSWLRRDAICVIDVEWVGRYGMILIDILADVDGNHAAGTRDVAWVKDKFSYINASHACLSIMVRKYFNTFSDANSYCDEVPYPTDGVVAIRDGSTETSKIKAIKSMELRHDGDGVLKDADDNIVAMSENAKEFDVDTIIEIRFTMDKTTKVPTVLDMFARSDKFKANSHGAVSNIITSALVEQTPGDNERRAALIWCSNIRKKLHIAAQKKRPDQSIILDVGSGDGQALDVALPSESVSYIYVEPDVAKCQKLRSRIGRCNIITDASDIIPSIRSLKTRATRAIILNNTLDAITDSIEVMERLCPELKSVTCVFSMHFVIPDLYQLAAFKVPVYGCTYMYDTADSDGVLLDTNGVVMKNVGDGTATVAWGRDEVYTEPATVRKDYAGIAKIIPGSDIEALPDERTTPAARLICTKVSVLMS